MDKCDWNRGPIIGAGSTATVSVGTRSGELFAVKSAEISRSEMLQKEQRILSLLSSPRIVSYIGHDVTTENGKNLYNLFMEYVPGGTLTDEINRQGGRLEESAIRSYTREILQGLAYLHSNNLVHCDIKGRNVLIGSDGCAKIADLGCAKWVRISANPVGIAGTPLFMAPEVARGEEQGFAADVWAVGCTVIEMATGRAPWMDVSDPVSALYRIGRSGDVPEFPCWVSDEAKDFLSKCLRRSAEERWTVDQLLNHPFVNELGSCKVMGNSFISNSPTSILDQDFWDSFDEEESHRDQTHILAESNDPISERIRRLSGGNWQSRMPDWTWEDNWVNVRRSDESTLSSTGGEECVIPAGRQMVCGSVPGGDGHQELEFCIEEGVIQNLNVSGECAYERDVSLTSTCTSTCSTSTSGSRCKLMTMDRRGPSILVHTIRKDILPSNFDLGIQKGRLFPSLHLAPIFFLSFFVLVITLIRQC